MGKKSTGIYQRQNGSWVVDKFVEGVRLYQSFESYEDAEAWLTRELEVLRQTRVHGGTPQITFDQAAGRYIEENVHLPSVESSGYHLKAVMPYVGDLLLEQVGISDQRDRWFRYRDRGFRPIVTDSVVGSS